MNRAARKSQAASIRAGAVDLGTLSGKDTISLMNAREAVIHEDPEVVFRRSKGGVVRPKDVDVTLEFEGGRPLARLEKAVKKTRAGKLASKALDLYKKYKK